MREFENDLQRIARASRILAVMFWSAAVIAAAIVAFVFLYWLPRHPIN